MTAHGTSRTVTGLRAQVPRAFAVLLAVVAVVCALAALSSAVAADVQPVRTAIDALLVPAPANLAYAVFLGVLAAAARRRKRLAWWVLLVYFSLTLVVGLTAGGLLLMVGANELNHAAGQRLFGTLETIGVWVGIAFAAAAVALLVAARREFYARVRPGSTWRALGVLAGLAVAFVGLGYLLLLVEPGSLHTWSDRLGYAVEKVFGGAVTLDVTRRGQAPGWVNLLLGAFGATAFLAALFTLVRSQRANAVLHAGEEERIRELLARHGERDSLGYFATRRDKAAVFSASGKAALTYRVVNGVSLASGDPVGDPEAWGPAIEAWLEHSRAYAWTPAVLGASEAGARAYRRHGLKVLQLGDEAILLTREFDLDGRDMRPVRQAVHRVERAGYTALVRRHAEIPPEELAQVAALATSWRDTGHERGFSMALGRLGDPADGDCVLVEARDGDGQVRGLLSFSPWGTRGVSLDLMRRDRTADNGVTEFMVAALLAAGPRLGVDRVSLNFAAFRSVFEQGARIGAGPVIRAWRHTLLFFSRWWQLESLYLSNAKYQPHWTPRYLCFAERRELARVGLAAAAAEGFLALPGGRPTPLHGVPPAGGGVGYVPPAAAAVRAVPPEPPAVRLPEQIRVRLAKLDRLRAEGVDPYPAGYPRTASCAAVRERHAGLAPDTGTGETVAVAGRVLLVRDHGRLLFVTVRDGSGDLQLLLEHDLDRWRSSVDIGDHVGAAGEVYATRRGEVSVRVASWELTAKCLRPLPDKHHGLADPEARVRQRYLDLALDPAAREMLRARGATLHSLRAGLAGREFLEVETPILQRVHGGANARPFVTHINAYDLRLSLRIAPELYLKRLAVGGIERVYELGRAFRNEGVDATHNPEFTVLEAYQAYADYHDMRELARELIVAAATAVHGEPVARRPGGELVDLGGEWRAVTVHEAISAALGEEVTADTEPAVLRKHCDAAGVPYDPRWTAGAVLLELYERLVEARTGAPTFYLDFPTEVSPLTRQHRRDPRLAERWDLVAYGMELGTAYTELVDPTEQRRRLTAQSLQAAGGDAEAMELDEDFLTALEYAMPPTGGLGLGVDRLVMLLTGRSIRETLPFPLVRESS
ncbi:bifunctional lysylphosphatidylglycerol synthetase/lysine--tRNA ligase LysX [Micromonospora sp. WMMC241]|uniref:bifunctional lysylphosphatidylglycerol synthetase/lysine--tRNA ligase LysX n=1 Tax=Micromonospora sp. WMMC241 TaxID=3015159 RepID=UPI0022B6B68C|nr:bifunctional lysylphosphatidylglycerol synthetase/lysine--tRNA ligase LysX [Micromonospora sp. WMMC241]MCZ7435659.1 bifunctional lysylphosphatidylglycerol synthetase/lysine--tRNA ligase LysX [Micromonospora sp. WMMC241]